MKTEVHIAELLNYHLKSMGSKLVLDSEVNQIGEQIASKTSKIGL